MEIRAQIPKSMKGKKVESWIYNKRIRVQSPNSMKDKDMESWIYNKMFTV